MRLNDLTIRSLKPPATGAKIYADDQVTGFGIRVSQAGTASYILTLPGRARDRITIGRVGIISLKDARSDARRRLADLTLNSRRPTRITFAAALAIFVAEKEKKNRASTVAENKRILEKYFVRLHHQQLSDITTQKITSITDKLAQTPGTALHAFWTIRTFLRWCANRRYIDRSPVEGLEAPTKTIFRERVLTDDELRELIVASTISGSYGRYIRMLAFTGIRRTEAAHLEREWVKGEAITIPARICKNGREHTFPFSESVAALLKELPDTGLLFPSSTGTPFSAFSKSKTEFDKTHNVTDWTLHDLRRTYATTLQRLGVRIEVIEALLNHISGSRAGIVGVYQRYDYRQEMREAVQKWEQHIQALLSATEGTQCLTPISPISSLVNASG
ncbi:MAG TPA: tyrosine-type recombinase/integrase [Rhizomicrobium sp.]|jgi:integrase|nr:tyrosine-type recombinase/integrase [Rhizomicrobium sp.]